MLGLDQSICSLLFNQLPLCLDYDSFLCSLLINQLSADVDRLYVDGKWEVEVNQKKSKLSLKETLQALSITYGITTKMNH